MFSLSNDPSRAAAPQAYDVTDLGTLGGAFTVAYDMNDAAQVVGYSTTGLSTRAFLWQNGQMTNLGALQSNGSAAFAVNGLGHVVGNSHLSNGNPRATLWRDGQIIDLTPFPTTSTSTEQVVGSSPTTIVDGVEQMEHAFLWENGVMTDLGVLPDDMLSTAVAMDPKRRQETAGDRAEHGRVLSDPLQSTPTEVLHEGSVQRFVDGGSDRGSLRRFATVRHEGSL